MDSQTRQHLLSVSLKHFADGGYAGTSVQEIVDEAGVAKPMLYYYFKSKAGLYQALIDQAHDARFELLAKAAGAKESLKGQLEAILVALFKFTKDHRELVRLAFASAFAAPGEVPPELRYREKCDRNILFFEELMQQAQHAGELDGKLNAHELAVAWYGLMTVHVMGLLLEPGLSYAEKRTVAIVDLFLNGAAARRKKRKTVRSQRTHRSTH